MFVLKSFVCPTYIEKIKILSPFCTIINPPNFLKMLNISKHPNKHINYSYKHEDFPQPPLLRTNFVPIRICPIRLIPLPTLPPLPKNINYPQDLHPFCEYKSGLLR